MATYVVGDIHGCFRAWLALKNKIEDQDPDAAFILVGDIVDRGPHVYEMLRWSMENITPSGKYQMVMGNHEAEKVNWLRDYFVCQAEAEENGKGITLYDMFPDRYDFHKMCIERRLGDQQLEEILIWLKELPYYKEKTIITEKGEQRFIIVHAALPIECINEDGGFNEKSVAEDGMDEMKAWEAAELRKRIVWERNYAPNPVAGNTIIVHGHTPTISQACKYHGAVGGKIWVNGNDINIDCGMVYGVSRDYKLYGDLAALRLEDLEEFYYYNHNAEG